MSQLFEEYHDTVKAAAAAQDKLEMSKRFCRLAFDAAWDKHCEQAETDSDLIEALSATLNDAAYAAACEALAHWQEVWTAKLKEAGQLARRWRAEESSEIEETAPAN